MVIPAVSGGSGWSIFEEGPDRKSKWGPHGLDVGKWARVHPLGAEVGPIRKNIHFINFNISFE